MLPNLSVLWVIAFVLFLTVVLDRLLFRPITRVVRERERRIESAEALADQAAARATEVAAELEARTAAARAEVYRQMDEVRRGTLRRRGELLAQTKKETETALADAATRVRMDVAAARAHLAREADELGAAIAARILGQSS